MTQTLNGSPPILKYDHHQYSNTTYTTNTTATNTQIRPIRPILKYDLYVQYSNTTYTANTTELYDQYDRASPPILKYDQYDNPLCGPHRRIYRGNLSSQNAFYCGNLIAECILLRKSHRRMHITTESIAGNLIVISDEMLSGLAKWKPHRRMHITTI